eukprot:5578218-Heterocapsa_arctica.AAC.1
MASVTHLRQRPNGKGCELAREYGSISGEGPPKLDRVLRKSPNCFASGFLGKLIFQGLGAWKGYDAGWVIRRGYSHT